MEKKKNSTIKVSSDSISFHDLRNGESDSTDFWVQNIGKTPIQLRFNLSPSSPFQLIHDGQKNIAPGLDTRATIKYTSNSAEVVKDTLIISCKDETINIPIIATPPCPRIVPEKTNINLGNIGNNTDFKFIFVLSNLGLKEGDFDISCSDESVSFVPKNGTISAEKSLEIAADFHPKKVGDHQFTINVTTDGANEPTPPIIVSAKSLPNSISLQINGSDISEFEFGTIYFGQKRVISATVVNNGPYKRSFVILPPKDILIEEPPIKLSGRNQVTIKEDIIFSACPPEGLLNPYEKKEIKLVFDPPDGTVKEEDLESSYNQFSSVEVVETGQRINFSLSGKSVNHFVSISNIDFDFDKSPIKNKTTKTLKINNLSHYLPITYEFQSIAQYRFEPSKGQISMNSSKEVKITFYPRNYGTFDSQAKISFNDGLFHKYINLKATCCSENENKPFKRTPLWETEKDILYNVEHPDTRYSYDLKQIKENQKKKELFDSYITDSAEARAKKKKEQEYLDHARLEAVHFLTSSLGANNFSESDIQEYIKSHKIQLNSKSEDNDLGIKPMEGLTPPDPPINKKASPLYIQNPTAFGLSKVNNGQNNGQDELNQGRQMKNDDNKFIKKKFKSKATTPAEINECNRTLTPAQQLMVVASHQTINIGQISVFATVVKSFTIENNLQQHILVSLNYEYEELSKSSPISQVIPPKQTAGFDLKFTSHKPQNFMKTIQYQINGRHTYSFTFIAQVIPIDLQINQAFVEFRFSPDSIVPIIKEFVTLTNKSNSRAEYNFTGLAPPFSMNNQKGYVEANKNLSLEITYNPGLRTHDEQDIVMNTLGGSSRALRLIGDTGNCKCSLSKKTINFGLIPIGISKTQSIRLKNTGEDDAIFAISVNNPGELQVSPMNGRVAARDSIQLQVTYKSFQPHPFNIQVSISICGSQPLSFNVIGQSELPVVQLENTEFEFGRVYVGSSASIETVISNIGSIPAILTLDLLNHPEFRIEFPTEYAESGAITLISDSCFITKMESTTEYISSDTFNQKNTKIEKNEQERIEKVDFDDINKNGLAYQIQLEEHTSLNFSLIFQPTEACDISFELPISLMNIITTNSFHLQPIVSAEGVQAPISLSTNTVDFGVSPIYDTTNPNSRSVVRTVSLLNEGKRSISWHFGELEEDVKKIFIIEPKEGELNGSSTQSVSIAFKPKAEMPYNAHLPLYVKSESEKDDNLIGKVQLNGVCLNLPFKVSLNEVCLPVVPLNTLSQMQVYVINQGFIEGTLKVQIACDESKLPIKVSFPEGNILSHSTEKLPLLVSFQSSRPLSFSTLVAILDDAGNAASFKVSCTTDNSCLTLFSYVKNNPIDMNNVELTCRFINVNDYLELKNVKWEPKTSPLMVKFVQRYLNALVLTNQITNFPDDLIANQGAKLVEAISNLTGTKKNLGDDKADTPEKRCESLRKILNSLISYGALLSSIKPEFLLSRSDFMHIMRQKVTRQLLGIDYFNAPEQSSFNQQVLGEFFSSKTFSNNLLKRLKILENLYDNLSIESWMIVLMQLFRLFIMPRVETEKIDRIPGVTDSLRTIKNAVSKLPNGTDILNEINKPSKVVSGSNIFSSQEMTLLKWCGIHYASVTADYDRKFNDFESFNDSAPFFALLKGHTRLSLPDLSKKTNDHLQKEQNAIELINSMKSLKLSFYPQMKEIVDGEQCLIAIILSYLFDTLPHYIPQSTLEFQTVLHKPITKMVTITNTSKSEINYKAIFEGNKNFVLTQDSITVSTGQTAEFPIFFTARTIKPITGRLSLVPSRPRFVASQAGNSNDNDAQSDTQKLVQPHLPQYSAPIVIDVVSAVSLTSPEQSLSLETQIYQPKKIEITVENKFNLPTNLTIFSHITKIEDENGRPIQDVPPLDKEMLSFINDPLSSSEKVPSSSDGFDEYVNKHQMIVLNTNSISFTNTKHTMTIEAEFVPISLGTYRCLLLFVDEKVGEFVYEIVAKSLIPQASEITSTSMSKMKTESGKKNTVQIPIDTLNTSLTYSLAYSIEKWSNIGQNVAERKMKDLVFRKQREIESIFKSHFTSQRFDLISSSPQYFEMPSEVVISKSENKVNSIQVTFKPSKAGEYPCKALLLSDYDVRCYALRGIGLAATKELNLEFNTLFGKAVKQEIPLNNNSKNNWQYKVTLIGDKQFSAPGRVSAKPNSVSNLPVTFSPTKIGQFQCEIQILNLNKESTVIYKCVATVGEPPTEDKLIINCRARQTMVKEIDLKPFIKNGTCEVTSTIPIISHPSEVTFSNGQIEKPFSFSIFAPRSGLSAGTITFTDSQTKNYVWYVVEIHVDSPKPEETLEVKTEARKSVTVSIPIKNPKSTAVTFTSHFQDDDFFGPKEFSVEKESSMIYSLVVCPLKATKKTSAIYFYSDDGGEFWYCIKIEATEPPENVLAQMTAPIGKYASTFILLENPTTKVTNYRVENDNSNAFQVVGRKVVTLNPREERRVEVRYIPTAVGLKETAKISFKSQETGDWLYRLSGTGKPPQPLSPTIVTATVNSVNSALILFNNPFQTAAKFSVSLGFDNEENNEDVNVFEFLNKRKVFTLNSYNEETQIPFTFQPKKIGQFKANIIVASVGQQNDQNAPGIRWIYPIIGNSHCSDANEKKVLKCRAHENCEEEFKLTLIGETESFQFSEYSLIVNLPEGYEFLRSVLDIKLISIEKNENSSDLIIKVKFSPKRPLKKVASLIVRNPLGQEWQFSVDLIVELGKIQDSLTIESLLNKTGSLKIHIKDTFSSQTPFHAYFVQGSASEFTVVPEHGIIQPTLQSSTELPLEVIFAPKMYGKVLKGMLAIDTIESQYLFDICGKTPEYVPPAILSNKIKNASNSSRVPHLNEQYKKARSSFDIGQQKKKNFIRDNINKARIVKPRVKSVINNPLKF